MTTMTTGNMSMTVGAAISMLLCTFPLSAYSTSSAPLLPSPIIRMVYCQEITTTPKLVELSERNWIREVVNVFPNARKFTPEEAFEYRTALKQVYKPTGRNRFIL